MNVRFINSAKKICIERDAGRCRHCGTSDSISVIQLVKREGRLAWHLSNLITLCIDCKTEADRVRNISDANRVGVILCGGRGTRLYPLTMYQNKHTLPIGLVPMLFYPIKTLRKFNVNRALIVTDREGTNETMKMLGSGKEFGMDFTYKIQEGAGGISEALFLAKDFANIGEEIVVILGDNIFDTNSLDTNVSLDKSTRACIWIKEVSNPQEYGVANIKNDRVSEIIEKPKRPISNKAVVGLYMYDYDVFDIITQIQPSDRGELEISSVNDYYAKQGQLTYRTVNGYWADCGGSIQRYCESSLHGARRANVSEEEVREFVSAVFDDK